MKNRRSKPAPRRPAKGATARKADATLTEPHAANDENPLKALARTIKKPTVDYAIRHEAAVGRALAAIVASQIILGQRPSACETAIDQSLTEHGGLEFVLGKTVTFDNRIIEADGQLFAQASLGRVAMKLFFLSNNCLNDWTETLLEDLVGEDAMSLGADLTYFLARFFGDLLLDEDGYLLQSKGRRSK